MKAFVWNRLFETGIASVDAEHRALVEIVNRLGVLMIEGKATSQSLSATFGELATYEAAASATIRTSGSAALLAERASASL